MKKLVLIIASFVIVALGGFYWWTNSTKPATSVSEIQRFVIPKGYSATQIGNKLRETELIKSSLAFRFYIQLTGRTKRIQAGEYELSGDLALFDIIKELLKGPKEIWITIPEGLRREEIVEVFINQLGLAGEEATSFRSEFLNLSGSLEGFLFPDTYLMPKDITAEKIVSKMNDTYYLVTTDLQSDLESSLHGLSQKQIITLASILERETRTDEERPIVAGVLLNRLEIGMGLQADASTQYAVGSDECKGKIDCEWWPILTRDDLEINSPYNTYRYNGLPPGPIANPGLSSIKAVVNAQETDYFYYIHDEKGQIYYAETLSEHNANVRKYLGK